MRRAVAYLRINIDSDEKLTQQRAAICAWATKESVSIVAWHADGGTSGTRETSQRQALCQAMGQIKACSSDFLVAANPDRLSRSLMQLKQIREQVQELGAEVAFAEPVGSSWALVSHLLPDLGEHIASAR